MFWSLREARYFSDYPEGGGMGDRYVPLLAAAAASVRAPSEYGGGGGGGDDDGGGGGGAGAAAASVVRYPASFEQVWLRIITTIAIVPPRG